MTALRTNLPFKYQPRYASGYVRIWRIALRIVEILHRSIPISRYANDAVQQSGLTTSIVAIVTDAFVDGKRLIGYGFTSIGRYAQDGLIRERFAPRLIAASRAELLRHDGAFIDPHKALRVMMKGEKAGGHGERCVAVGALDMAIWDIAGKASGQPLYRLLASEFGDLAHRTLVPVYAAGGYQFPQNDIGRLRDEMHYFDELGFTLAKIKIGADTLANDVRRIETALSVLGDGNRLAVDAMNAYTPTAALETSKALEPFALRWFEDICDPLDYDTHRIISEIYAPPISVGEAIFSLSDVRNLIRYSGLRPGYDVLTFDPAHCYGIAEYTRIITLFEAAGWSRRDFQAHGGHLFSLHVAAGLGLGGCECSPHNFQPFGGFSNNSIISFGMVAPPENPGIGFETRSSLIDLFQTLLD